VGGLSYGTARPAVAQIDLAAVSKYMFWLVANLSWSYAAFLSAARARG
jgi:hypothetical protein